MCVYIYIHIYMYIYIYVYTHTHTHIYLHWICLLKYGWVKFRKEIKSDAMLKKIHLKYKAPNSPHRRKRVMLFSKIDFKALALLRLKL